MKVSPTLERSKSSFCFRSNRVASIQCCVGGNSEKNKEKKKRKKKRCGGDCEGFTCRCGRAAADSLSDGRPTVNVRHDVSMYAADFSRLEPSNRVRRQTPQQSIQRARRHRPIP